MYFQPKDGYPNMPKYGIFSVGDIVNRKGSATLGHIVRIYNPKWSDAPHITVEWFGNASIGDHDSSNLELYMTRQQWLDDIAKRKKEVEDDKDRKSTRLNSSH